MQPTTRYAKAGSLNIAYQVIGKGPLDLLMIPGFVSHVDLIWADEGFSRWMERLASFARVILFDKRGVGASDPVTSVPTLEERIEDARAVLDAVGTEKASLFGYSEGGPMSVLFSCTYPERTHSLILYGTIVKGIGPEAWAQDEAVWDRVLDMVDHWGEGHSLDIFSPSIAVGGFNHRLQGVFERTAASPAMARALIESFRAIDVSSLLPAVRVPTLVLHRKDDFLKIEAARFMAEHIKGARLVELPGVDHIPWVGDSDVIVDELEEFLTGVRGDRQPDRILTTILFTDIVGSTEQATRMGDQRWRVLLELQRTLVRRELGRFGGREIDTAGDGFLALFDGPGRAIRCACAIVESVRSVGLNVRAGLHTGEAEIRGRDVAGIAVHIGARVASIAGAGEILVSRTVKDLVFGSGVALTHHGAHTLKGVPGEWDLYKVSDVRPDPANVPRRASLDSGETMRRSDRLIVGATRRAPWLGRALLRAARRSPVV